MSATHALKLRPDMVGSRYVHPPRRVWLSSRNSCAISSLCIGSARSGRSASGPPRTSQYVLVSELAIATTSRKSTNCSPSRLCTRATPRSTLTALDGRGGVFDPERGYMCA
jgi:hypothetical protein